MQRRCIMQIAGVLAIFAAGMYAVFLAAELSLSDGVEEAVRDLAVLLAVTSLATWLVQQAVAEVVAEIHALADQLGRNAALVEEVTRPIAVSPDMTTIRKAFRVETENAMRFAADKAVRGDLVARATAPVHQTVNGHHHGLAVVVPIDRDD